MAELLYVLAQSSTRLVFAVVIVSVLIYEVHLHHEQKDSITTDGTYHQSVTNGRYFARGSYHRYTRHR